MKGSILVACLLLCASFGVAQITTVSPNSAVHGQSLTVTFTSGSIAFGTSTSCLHVDTSNIIFANAVYPGIQYNANHFYLQDSMHLVAQFHFPSSAFPGMYNASIGSACTLTQSNAFTITGPPPPNDFNVSYSPSPSPGTSLQVIFTDNQNRFFNGSTNCLVTDSTNILFLHNPTGVTYKPANVVSHFVSQEKFLLSLPPNAPEGNYDIIAGFGSQCPLHCYGCMSLNPNIIFQGQLYPNVSLAGQTRQITYTDNNNFFVQSTNVIDTTTICFSSSWPNYGFSFHAQAFNVVNGDTVTASVHVPANAPPGIYNAGIGSGAYVKSCQNCFTVATSTVSPDLAAHYTANGLVRPGSVFTNNIIIENYGTTSSNPQVVFTADPGWGVTTYTTIPVVDSVIGNNFYFTLDSVHTGAVKYVFIYYDVPQGLPLGTVLTNSAAVFPTSADFNPSNNYSSRSATISNSYDPNEKTVYPSGNISPGEVMSQMPLDYVVEFQNTGNAPAIDIVVVDTLSTNLDLNTFRFIASSHYSSYDLSAAGILRVTFHNIMLPDSTSDKIHSTGYFRYTIAPKATLQIGDVIKNTAYIYFDNNQAVVTNTTNNLVSPLSVQGSRSQNKIELYPNPSSGYVLVKGSPQHAEEISIFDMAGKEVRTMVYDRAISLEGLAPGLYFIIIRDKDGVAVSANKVLLAK